MQLKYRLKLSHLGGFTVEISIVQMIGSDVADRE
ncbi:hypothetical protein SPLC1_S082230 [Arthrospira platensis C1]|uniref:Uncharacterized protein n=1 Tax=Limnospira maxima CS-328 TaxID=513049 RepID=B5VU75_LIMMA|nr:hypothetical protein AmaxDRAFT_0116 [Limnospira maxima CS-328]EKD10548.1 hypothetical protein SPLC1_S082230 [Arthrospira platensis C1]UWU50883.1 hypothetical protein APLC1_5828 [Arthrospira platensis C1]